MLMLRLKPLKMARPWDNRLMFIMHQTEENRLKRDYLDLSNKTHFSFLLDALMNTTQMSAKGSGWLMDQYIILEPPNLCYCTITIVGLMDGGVFPNTCPEDKGVTFCWILEGVRVNTHLGAVRGHAPPKDCFKK